jgi:hypothetical protein
MKRDGKRLAVAMSLAIAMIAASSKPVAAQDATPGKARSVSIGVWGGPDVEMQVTHQGAALEFDCAQGTISEPLLLDEAGKFLARGTFQSQHGGPIKRDEPLRSVDVVYTGIVQGDTMRLEFVLGDNKGSPEKFTLVRGQTGKLRKCR